MLLCAAFTSSVSADTRSPWSLELTAATGYYQYDATEVRDKLPASFQAGLDANDLDDQDDDLLNYSLGLGYQLSPDTLVKVTFVDGIDLDPFLQDFCLALCPDDDVRFNLDMFLYEVDVEYTAYRFNDEVSLCS